MHPRDLLPHRMLSFARWKPRDRWIVEYVEGINDYARLAPAMIAGVGIGELPLVVLPHLSRKEVLVDVMLAARKVAVATLG